MVCSVHLEADPGLPKILCDKSGGPRQGQQIIAGRETKGWHLGAKVKKMVENGDMPGLTREQHGGTC